MFANRRRLSLLVVYPRGRCRDAVLPDAPLLAHCNAFRSFSNRRGPLLLRLFTVAIDQLRTVDVSMATMSLLGTNGSPDWPLELSSQCRYAVAANGTRSGHEVRLA